MLKAKIDATCYPVVRVESKEKSVALRRARYILEFRPSTTRKHDFLLYFQDEEEGGETL